MSDQRVPHQFVLLGSTSIPPLMNAVLQSSDHKLVGSALSDRHQGLSDGIRVFDDWESLVADPEVDAVLVNDTRPEVLEFAVRLATRGKPLIVPAWPSFPPEFVAELALYDAEDAAPFVPLFDHRDDVTPLHKLIVEGHLGEITSIRIDRTDLNVDGSAGAPAWYSGVRFEDLDWMRVLGGDYSQVTLIRSGGDERETFVTQTLQLAGPGLADATCTYRRSRSEKLIRICVDGSEGIAEFHLQGEGDQRERVLSVNGAQTLRTTTRVDPKKACETINRSWRRAPGSAQWRDFVRVHEINEAMQRSLRRRRTIDLHFEIASERSEFKTRMATVGCFVLVYTFFASIGLLFAGAVLDPRDDLQRTSEAARMIVRQGEFESTSDRLTTSGEQHLKEIAEQWQSSGSAVVIVEANLDDDGSGQLSPRDLARLAAVRQRLSDHGIPRLEERTVARPLASKQILMLMNVGRVIAFAPLGVFLLMQLLLFVSRPAQLKGGCPAPESLSGSETHPSGA